MTTTRVHPFSKMNKAVDTKKKFMKKRPYTSKHRKVVSFGHDKSIVSYEPRVSHDIDSKESSPMDRALEIQANFASKSPSFVKYMLKSHVTGGFWLGLPKNFTAKHLPEHDETVVLVDETQVEHETKYLAEKNGLSAGWRGFSIAHELKENDVLVFHLIQPCKFKVYVVRGNALTETHLAISLENLGACGDKVVDDRQKKELKITVLAREEHVDQYSHVHGVKEKGMVALSNNADAADNHSGMDIDNYGSDDYVGIRISQSIDFKDVKTFENFNIIVYGFIIDCEIPQHLRVKYYELCCSQKSYLHDQLTVGLKLQQIVKVILQVTNIADAIRSSNPTSSEYLKIWDNAVKDLEVLGMKVGFLRARIRKLVTLSSDSTGPLRRKILEKVKAEEELKALKLEKMTAEEEFKALIIKKVKAGEALNMKLISVKKVIGNSDCKIEYMKRRVERIQAAFLEESKAPW